MLWFYFLTCWYWFLVGPQGIEGRINLFDNYLPILSFNLRLERKFQAAVKHPASGGFTSFKIYPQECPKLGWNWNRISSDMITLWNPVAETDNNSFLQSFDRVVLCVLFEAG